jgi:hypothetical protein
MSDIAVHPRKLEFVCAQCLFVRMGTDTQPIPWCPRCRIRLTPDDLDVPRSRAEANHNWRTVVRQRGR